jgi:hypothetical protein
VRYGRSTSAAEDDDWGDLAPKRLADPLVVVRHDVGEVCKVTTADEWPATFATAFGLIPAASRVEQK